MTATTKFESSPIGAVFTPIPHAQSAIRQNGLYKAWLRGASILDPTAGSGHFIEAFIKTAREMGDRLTESRLNRLSAVEMESRFIDDFHRRMKRKYAVDFPENRFIAGDYLFTEHREEFDFLIGNPPWLNFCDLEESYKEKIKPLFISSGLGSSKKDLLLGNSRIDLAALIVSEAIRKDLKMGGKAYFFLPLSLFLGEGAHKQFRRQLNTGLFSLDGIIDYRDFPIFQGISTRYGYAGFTKGHTTKYPINYSYIKPDGTTDDLKAGPMEEREPPHKLHIREYNLTFPRINISDGSKPRQGLNTCGANKLFIFDEAEELNDNLIHLKNKHNEAVLPSDLVYPLIGAGQFRDSGKHKYVFLPYNRNGKVLTADELSRYKEAVSYLNKNRSVLENRKGVLIGSAIKKGLWWSLLGVGPYSFSSWKIVWEAYGKKNFHPRLFSSENGQTWQPNQALQAFLSFDDEDEARIILNKLKDPRIEEILKKQGMEGTCNWAQPGKMKKFFRIKNEN